MENLQNQINIVEISDNLLDNTRKNIEQRSTFALPISQIATLGASFSGILPFLHNITQKTTTNATGLYKLVNGNLGSLKIAKNGNFWGAIKCADGTSKMAQLQSVGSLSTTTGTIKPTNLVTIIMAVALFSIEKKLNNIEQKQKQILEFLEIEKESEIEADVEVLISVLKKYKLNWDNAQFLQNNHKMVLDLQRTARKNMLSYQKTISDFIKKKQFLATQKKIQNDLEELIKKFKYYRLSIYTFSLASLLEIMLSGNFDEKYIEEIKNEINTLSDLYCELFRSATDYLEKESSSGLKTNLLNGIGTASGAFGRFIGNIPKIKDGNADEYLQNEEKKLKNNATDSIQTLLSNFSEVNSPEVNIFTEKMQDLILIYNHTDDIYFDDTQIYLCQSSSN